MFLFYLFLYFVSADRFALTVVGITTYYEDKNPLTGDKSDTTDPTCLITAKLRQIGNPNVFTSGAEKCFFNGADQVRTNSRYATTFQIFETTLFPKDTDTLQMELSMTCFENNCGVTFNGNDCRFDDNCVSGLGQDDRKVTTTLGGIFQPDLQVNSFVTLKVGGVDTFKIEFSLLWARSMPNPPVIQDSTGLPPFVLATMGFVVPTATTMTPNSGDTMNQMGESTTTNGGGGTSAPASNGGTVAAVVIVVLICVVASIVVGVLLLRRLQSQKAQLEQQQQAAAGGGGSGAPSSSSHYSQPRDSAAYTPVASAGGYSKSPINNQYGNLSLTQPLDEHSTYTSMPSERDIATASSASSSAAS